jgi:hypothetical protein
VVADGKAVRESDGGTTDLEEANRLVVEDSPMTVRQLLMLELLFAKGARRGRPRP